MDTGTLQLNRYPLKRQDKRIIYGRYHWIPGMIDFRIIHADIIYKKKEHVNDARIRATEIIFNRLSFKQLLQESLKLGDLDIISAHFVDDRQNYWFLALNPGIFSVIELNTRLKNNFLINIEKGHTKEQLLRAVCGTECFLLLTNELWSIDFDMDSKLYKMLEIVIFTMSFINEADLLNGTIFRASLGFRNDELKNKFQNLSQETWYKTLTNKQLFFDLYYNFDEELQSIKDNIPINNYSSEILEYFSILHGDNCIYLDNGNQHYLNTLKFNKITQQSDLEETEIINTIHTSDFRCLTINFDPNLKHYNTVVGNEMNHFYVMYDNITPIKRTTKIIDKTIQICKQFIKNSKKTKQKTAHRRIFKKILNFKIPGYYSE